VAAAVILNQGVEPSTDALLERLRDELAAYKVPRHVFFCTRDELPFTESGKIQKTELMRMLAERIDDMEPE
jgi:fatty-acyl-CoA synthase